MTLKTFLVFLTASTHRFLRLPTGVSCRQSGGAPLQVIWLAAPLSAAAAADRDSVDTAAVAVTWAMVTYQPSAPWRPDEDRAPPVPALRLIGEADRGL